MGGFALSLWTSFLIAFSVLLPLINPLGSALVFLGLVGEAPTTVFRSLARRIAINNIRSLHLAEKPFFRHFVPAELEQRFAGNRESTGINARCRA